MKKFCVCIKSQGHKILYRRLYTYKVREQYLLDTQFTKKDYLVYTGSLTVQEFTKEDFDTHFVDKVVFERNEKIKSILNEG